MSERVAVVTGANRGLGLAAVKELAQQGYHVMLTARSLTKAEQAAEGIKGKVTPVQLDVASDESINGFCDWLEKQTSRVDVLINNAGAIFGEPGTRALEVPASTVEQAFITHTLGPYRLSQRIVPVMNAAGYGRVVNVSSGMGALNDMEGSSPAYRISKAALNAVTRVFHAVAEANVKVNSVCPGWVRTDLGGQRATRSIKEGVAGIIWAATLLEDGPSGGFFRDGKPIPW